MIKNKLKLVVVAILFVGVLNPGLVHAQSHSGTSSSTSLGGSSDFQVDPGVGLLQINIPFFKQIEVGGPYATIFSWVSFIGGVVSIGVIGFWIYLLINASAHQLKNAGNAEQQTESFKKLKSTFVGAGIAIAFPIVISVFGIIFGLGPLWAWPSALRSCPGDDTATDSGYSFYFQARLVKDSDAEAEAFCGI